MADLEVDDAQPYDDTAIVEDSCSSDNMSFGIAVTETLDDDVPDKRRPVVEQEYDLDDDVDGQPVGRQTGARGGTSTFLCQQPGGR